MTCEFFLLLYFQLVKLYKLKAACALWAGSIREMKTALLIWDLTGKGSKCAMKAMFEMEVRWMGQMLSTGISFGLPGWKTQSTLRQFKLAIVSERILNRIRSAITKTSFFYNFYSNSLTSLSFLYATSICVILKAMRPVPVVKCDSSGCWVHSSKYSGVNCENDWYVTVGFGSLLQISVGPNLLSLLWKALFK